MTPGRRRRTRTRNPSGVTGSEGSLHPGLPAFVDRLRTLTHRPVGIGVSTPQQAARVGTYADAVIVGSAFIGALDSAPGPAGAPPGRLPRPAPHPRATAFTARRGLTSAS
ncbi:tryptophan synthase subunit alpha [Streptomyces sp. NRRL S-475]|uniref:tryptophan synthase subunit alpha n=1 Tax=Streptomyces sp. NRRL S-475 TaxID=1463910 RepID=UPI000B20725F|nr:tryptophan synthase subunit alpha [Streptomyces sp. NRRL S-475]